jgi:uncharacterized membrane protein YdjX (TVP38/TMEM64 family)
VEDNVGETPAIYRWLENAVNKAGGLMLFLMPGSNVVCVLVGHRKMRIGQFFAIVIPGICFRLMVMRIGGDIFEDQVRWFLKSIESYQWYIVLGLFAISAIQMKKRRPLAPPDPNETNEH